MAEISIIVPVYKVELYLHECIDSLICQTFTDIEIILVDDGSPDNCGKICDEYAKKDNRIKVIHKQNAGLSSARNSGLEIANGKYICFIDSDDYVSDDFCQILYELLDGTSYDYSVCGVNRFQDGDKPSRNLSNKIHTYTNDAYLGLQLNKKREFGVWNKLYKREIFEQLRFKDGKLHEDVFFSGDLAKNCRNGVIEVEQSCLFYRQRKGSIVSQSSEKCSPDLVDAGSYVTDIVKANYPDLFYDSLWYAIRYTWTFVDKIYVAGSFRENRAFMFALQRLIRTHKQEYKDLEKLALTDRKRILLFAKSRFLYGFNAYARLFRVYLYKILKKDAYSDGHGI